MRRSLACWVLVIAPAAFSSPTGSDSSPFLRSECLQDSRRFDDTVDAASLVGNYSISLTDAATGKTVRGTLSLWIQDSAQRYRPQEAREGPASRVAFSLVGVLDADLAVLGIDSTPVEPSSRDRERPGVFVIYSGHGPLFLNVGAGGVG